MFLELLTKNTSGELINTDNICSMFQQSNSISILFTGVKEGYEKYLFNTSEEAERVYEAIKNLVQARKI